MNDTDKFAAVGLQVDPANDRRIQHIFPNRALNHVGHDGKVKVPPKTPCS